MSTEDSSDEDIPGLESVSSSEVRPYGRIKQTPTPFLSFTHGVTDLLRMCKILFDLEQIMFVDNSSNTVEFVGQILGIPYMVAPSAKINILVIIIR